MGNISLVFERHTLKLDKKHDSQVHFIGYFRVWTRLIDRYNFGEKKESLLAGKLRRQLEALNRLV